MDSDIQWEIDGGIAVVRINRPDVANAVRPETIGRLNRVLDSLREDASVRAVVLSHTGKHFMAGGDLEYLQSLPAATLNQIRDNIYNTFQGATRRLYDYPKPTVAAVGGAAITVGCELAIACDFRVVTKDSFFQESWLKVGLVPPLGGLKRLPALVGLGVASDMILRARPVYGEEAVARGLATELAEEGVLEATAVRIASEAAAMGPLAYAAAKSGMQDALESTMAMTLEKSILTQGFLLKSEDFREGVAAAVQRRPARFSGQ